MAVTRKEPLLTFTLVTIRILTILLAVAAVGLILASGYIAFGASDGELLNEYANADAQALRRWLLILVPLAVVAIGLAVYFMRLLGEIVRTAAKGSPFVADNARRLRKMAWLAIAFQALTIPIGFLEARFEEITQGGTGHPDIDIAGFVLALVLFVLARVFERGTEMQSELEGTV